MSDDETDLVMQACASCGELEVAEASGGDFSGPLEQASPADLPIVLPPLDFTWVDSIGMCCFGCAWKMGRMPRQGAAA